MKPLLRAALTSEAFWAPENRAALIKSPVELVVGTLRTFGIHPFDLRPAVFACAALGQNPFSPPNVKGWPGGQAWIDSTTLLGRKQWLERLFRGSDPMTMVAAGSPERGEEAKGKGPEQRFRRLMERGMAGYGFDAERFARSVAATSDRSDRIERLVLATAAVNRPIETEELERLRSLVSDPAYQLK